MDCEFVGVGFGGHTSALARCSIVNHHGYCVYDKFVKPTEVVRNYRTPVSGVRERDLQDGEFLLILLVTELHGMPTQVV